MEILAPESTAIGLGPDTAGIGDSLKAAMGAATRDPGLMMKAASTLTGGLSAIPTTVLTDWINAPKQAKDSKHGDRRFSDPAWTENPYFHAVLLAYQSGCDFARTLVSESGLDHKRAMKAKLGLDLMLDAVAPSNFLLTNPTALKRAFDTAGVSLLKGARNFTSDLLKNRGMPSQVDTSGFELGRNLAVTPSKVVYRNELMELLQYQPQTEKVHEVPLLCSPPWINKYYIMDLAPQRSFIEWAVQHGRTVFAISYRNPTAEMARTTMDDYLISGPQHALDVIREITGASKIDMVGLCLGGALTAITAAYLAQTGDDRIGSLTLLNTMLDYAEPGQLGVFTDEAAVQKLEKEMAKSGGTLPGKSMAGTFDVLRANDLIFSYMVSNWLLGQTPAAFDILAWNSDSTQMPAAMHTFYLRNFYVKNLLAQGELEISGLKIDLNAVKSSTYIVSAKNDHIVPWESAYKTTGLISGATRFVLSNGGHIAGIVNPPGPKAWFMSNDDNPATGEAWAQGATRKAESWWVDWTAWAGEQAGPMVEPPKLGSRKHKVLGDGPGEYVLE